MKTTTPDRVRYIDVYGALYYIRWEDMQVGHSVFIKTTASAKVVKQAIGPAAKYFSFYLKAHNRCEFGYYGVRIWRLG